MEKRFWIYAALAAAFFLAMVYALPYVFNMLPGVTMPSNANILDLNFTDATVLRLHIHPYLEIWVLGKNQSIPADIGISAQGQRIIHTHDDTGKIHVESPWNTRFYLKDFFYVWGKRFDRQCVFDYCADKDHTLKVYVNGTESQLYGDLPLEDGETIKIVYS